MFGGFELIATLIFATVIGVFLFSIIGGITTWHRNNQSPKATEEALVLIKRTNVSRNNHIQGGANGTPHHHSSTSTTYYITFAFADSTRKEFLVGGKEYGLLAEGDAGKLSYQGTRYLSFERSFHI